MAKTRDHTQLELRVFADVKNRASVPTCPRVAMAELKDSRLAPEGASEKDRAIYLDIADRYFSD